MSAEAKDDMKIEEVMEDIEKAFLLTTEEKKVISHTLFKVGFFYSFIHLYFSN